MMFVSTYRDGFINLAMVESLGIERAQGDLFNVVAGLPSGRRVCIQMFSVEADAKEFLGGLVKNGCDIRQPVVEFWHRS